MQATQQPIHRFEALDALRGVCACMVALMHFETVGVISNAPLVKSGFLFVDFFFVLSGFVISAGYRTKLEQGFSIGKFMILRLGRVYPLHFVILAAFLIFEVVFALGWLGSADRQPFTNYHSVPALISSLLLVQIFFGPDGGPWNAPAWSIAAEVWTYLLFAMLFRFGRQFVIPACVVMIVGTCLYIPTVTDRYLYLFHDGAWARCILGFALGVVAFEVRSYLPMPNLSFATASGFEAAMVFSTVVALVYLAAGPTMMIIPFVFFVAVLLFSYEGGLISRLLKRRLLLRIGTLSYSIYMVHWFLISRLLNVMNLIDHRTDHRWNLITDFDGHGLAGGSPLVGDLMSIAYLLFVISVSWVTHRWIEQTGQRWSRRMVLVPSETDQKQLAESNVAAP